MDNKYMKENLLMLNNIMEHSVDSIYFKDKDLRFIAVNKSMATKCGFVDPSEMTGKTDFDIFTDHVAKEMYKIEKKIYETGLPNLGMIKKMTLKNGITIWASSSKQPYYDENNKIIGIWGIDRDITDYNSANDQLSKNDDWYSKISEHNQNTFDWEVDEHGLFTYISDVSEIVLGYNPDELINKKHLYDLGPKEDREKLKQAAFSIFKHKRAFKSMENKALTKDGRIKWMLTSGIPLINEDGTLQGYRGSDTEITERVDAMEILKRSEEKFKMYTERAPFGIFITDEHGKFLEVNKKECEMSGYSEDEFLKMTIFDIVSYDFMNKGLTLFNKMIKESQAEGDICLRKKNNDEYWINLTILKLSDNKSIGFCKDITMKKEIDEKILHLSYHDQLTGLFNHRYYIEALKKIDLKQNLPLAIIMGDVNGLKEINDNFGHDLGDELLIKAAKVIKQGCRKCDIIARLGGDEFVIILPKTDNVDVEKIIKHIRKLSLNEKIADIDISIAFGYAIKRTEEEKIQDLFRIAEDQMYLDKRSNSNTEDYYI